MEDRDALHVGDVNVGIRLEVKDDGVATDLSGATLKKILLQAPDGTVTEHDADFVTDGADGLIQYVTASADDLSVAGEWLVQGRLTMPTFIGHTSRHRLRVFPNLTAQ